MAVQPRGNRLTGLSVGKSNLHAFTIDPSRTNWQADGKCAQPGVKPDDWFPTRITEPGDDAEDSTPEQAERLCRGCPVKRECYEYAVANKLVYGVFGGATPGQRARGVGRELDA